LTQHPFTSMIKTTRKEVLCFIKRFRKKRECTSARARRANQRFHVIEIALERPPAEGSESVFRLGDTSGERFDARDVVRVLELARMHTEIAVAGLEQRFQLVERETVTHRQRAHDREPDALVKPS